MGRTAAWNRSITTWPWSGNRLNTCRDHQLKRVSFVGRDLSQFIPSIQSPLCESLGHPETGLRIRAALSQAECSVVYTQYNMRELLRFFWNSTRGHRLAPWRSPYLRWRMETYSGLKMDKIGFVEFWGFMVRERKQLRRFLKWTAEMDNYARPKPKNP
jgi:hypothetical protein